MASRREAPDIIEKWEEDLKDSPLQELDYINNPPNHRLPLLPNSTTGYFYSTQSWVVDTPLNHRLFIPHSTTGYYSTLTALTDTTQPPTIVRALKSHHTLTLKQVLGKTNKVESLEAQTRAIYIPAKACCLATTISC